MRRVILNNRFSQLASTCLLALSLSMAAAAQPVTPEEGKVMLLGELLKHATWPEENQIDRFIIGLYGRDKLLLKALRNEVPDLQIRGKPVIAEYYERLEDAKKAHVLVLSPARNPRLEEISRKLHLSQTLIVTDGSKDQRNIMLNFTHPSPTRLSFEINNSNIVYAGLQLSKAILLFGGTELDVATIYKQTEAELVRAKAVAMQQQEQLKQQEDLLKEQQGTIEKQRAQVAENKAELSKLAKNLSDIQTMLEESSSRLRENEASLVEKENVLAEKEAYIQSYSERIDTNQQRLEAQQGELRNQELRIAEQNTVLDRQVATIENQQFILTAAVAALLLVLSLIAIIFRGYRSKHRLAMKLEGKTSELEVANEKLVQLTEAKSLFLSTMSHEIRTPMNGVIGMAELLEGTQLSGQQREYLSLIIKSADTLLGLINDILDFSKIEAGRLDLEAIPFNLRDILGDTLQSLGLRAAEKGLELGFHIPPEVPDRLIGDPIRLRQVVVNLVGNAIKFTHEGEVVVDLHLESHQDQAARISFEVRDTGVGITERQQRKIFEAFGQADSSTTRQFGGTGLGLSIASQLAEMMGGHMAVKSRLGEGSTFSFSGNFEVSDEPATIPLHPDSLQGQRVLVVDDNSTNRMILEELLQNWGMQVHAVDSGAAALAELEKQGGESRRFDLALLDVMMPVMDGFMLAGEIRKKHELRDLPILMLTSAGRTDQEEKHQHLDIARILLKPTKHSALLSAITDALGVTLAGERPGAATAPAKAIKARQVLLVEDNPVNQKVAQDLLHRRGHKVEVAQNGQEAVELLGRRSFDVVLMDIHMPVMDGLTATRTIRELEHGTGQHVPIVAMTAGATTDDRESCFSAGMDDFVSKPFRADELYAVVEAREATAVHREPSPALAQTEEAGPCLDWEGALGNLEGDEELLIELSGMFLEQCPTLMTQMDQAISEGEAEELQRAAHTLKGSARIIGGQAAAAVALELEHMGRDGELEAAGKALDTLSEQVDELKLALLSHSSPDLSAATQPHP